MKRGMATDAPKSSKCNDCLPLWDRTGNVKAIQLCGFHQGLEIAARKAEKIIDALLEGYLPSTGDLAEFRAAVRRKK